MRIAEITPIVIASRMRIPLRVLWLIAKNMPVAYKATRRVRINEKLREIDAPQRWMKIALRRLHKLLLEILPRSRAVHGGIPCHSCFTAAEHHLGKASVITRDLSNAYPSITHHRLRRSLEGMGFRKDTSMLLSLLMTLRNRVPQGSPTSSDALNTVLDRADGAIAFNLGGLSADYTRFFDDLVLSVNQQAHAEEASRVVDGVLAAEGHAVNVRKKASKGRQDASQPQVVHGTIVNGPGGVAIPREKRRAADDVGTRYVRGARAASPDSLRGLLRLRQQLLGYANYFRQARYHNAEHLRRQAVQGDRLIRNRLAEAGDPAWRAEWPANTPAECDWLSGIWRKRFSAIGA